MTLTASQQQRMQAGRARQRAEQQVQARARVKTYRAWLKAGGDPRTIPPVPSSADFRAAGGR